MRTFYSEFKKIFTSGGFYACILFTLILLFFSEVYSDPTTMNRYTVVRALTDISEQKMLHTPELCNVYVMENAVSQWLLIFLPILSAFCFVPQICMEKESGALRFYTFRTSKLKFSLSRYFSGILSGSLAIVIGYAIFCAAIFFLFPGEENFPNEFLETDMVFDILMTHLGIFLTSFFWSMPAMLLACFLNNKYLIMCIPLFIKYSFSQFIFEERFKAIKDQNMELLGTLGNIEPDAMMSVGINPDIGWTFLLFGILSLVFLIVYAVVEKRRCDCGA